MAVQCTVGNPVPADSFPDYPVLSPSDLMAVIAQTSAMIPSPTVSRKQFTETTRSARRAAGGGAAAKPRDDRRPQGLTAWTGDDDEVHAAFAELLVRAQDYEGENTRYRTIPLKVLLAEYDVTPIPVPELDGRILRLVSDRCDAAQFADIAALLVAAGYQASVNLMMPLGSYSTLAYVTKGVGNKGFYGNVGPEPTTSAGKPSARVVDKDPRVQVAVIDTGVADQQRTDNWLAAIERDDTGVDPLYEHTNAAAGEASGETLDVSAGHGTFVSGIIEQIAPAATVRHHRAIDGDGVGSDLEVAVALWAAAQDHFGRLESDREQRLVVNLSLGATSPGDQPPLATQVALELIAERQGADDSVVVIAGAGNYGSTRPVWPAAFSSVSGLPLVVAVAGLTLNREPARWSSHGFWVDCSVPAEGVLSMFVNGRESPTTDGDPDRWQEENPWAVWTGSSFAAPQVAGLIARMCLADRSLSPRSALRTVLSRGVSVPDYGKALEILPIRV